MNNKISILYPNYDLKTGDLQKNIYKWIRQTGIPANDYQLIIGTKRLDPEEAKRIKNTLRKHDILFTVHNEENDNSIWNRCAARSKNKYLLFVEGHVTPRRNFLRGLSKIIRNKKGIQVVNTQAKNTTASEFEKTIDQWFLQTIQQRAKSHNFTFVSRWAFLIERSLFRKIGPFEPSFEQFAPPFFSARLAKNHISIHETEPTGLVHEMEKTISHHHDATRSYVRGYVCAEKTIIKEELCKYFSPNPFFAEEMKKNKACIKKQNPFTFLRKIYIRTMETWIRRTKIKILENLVMRGPLPAKIKLDLFKRAHHWVTIDEFVKAKRL